MATQGGLASNLDLRALAGVLERATSPSIQERLMSTPAVITSLTHPVKPMDSPTTIGDSDDPISTRRARKRADVKNLHRVLQEEERQALELRAALKHAGERLTTESERTNEMERRLVEYEKRERSLARARRRAESLAVRADAEAKAYKLHLELANRENAKAQQAVDALAKDRTEAEEAAARARSTARRLQEKLIFERARQLGRQEGLQDGLKQGFDEGLDIGWQEGRDDGYDEMRSRALLAFEEALKSGAIQSTADFDLNAAIKSERAKLRAIAAARPTRRTSLRPLTSRGSNYNSSLRVKSPELMQDAIDSGPMPFPTPRTKDEMPLAPPPEIQVIATTPPATTIDPSQRAIVPRSSFQGMPVVNHPPVDPIPDGFVPTIGANGKFVLPPPHEIGPSPVPSRTPSPSAANIPLPNSAYAPSTTSHDPLNARSPPVRRKSIGAENRAFEEAARLRREKEIAEQGYAELMEELERERAQREAERKKREEDERERDAQRRRERELELALERTREEEREAERERIRSLEKKNELARAQELERERQERERERQERLRAEEESRQKDAEPKHWHKLLKPQLLLPQRIRSLQQTIQMNRNVTSHLMMMKVEDRLRMRRTPLQTSTYEFHIAQKS
ncbi:uncharacterized protein EI90DRAFT_1412796 [Cantharellus anzutake]|uniref:uncharacterized protein n=1 Tax=Cantharellus anzutake TaxID=1750568 RepID=UPI001906C854|nr:uncharacterized protein EI90DRAFT_1412796 [Cantharellus anzutake]KAF8329570.1 hypothetical protein EI90DRAFT_1412796 [Cantharellus anzutake]